MGEQLGQPGVLGPRAARHQVTGVELDLPRGQQLGERVGGQTGAALAKALQSDSVALCAPGMLQAVAVGQARLDQGGGRGQRRGLCGGGGAGGGAQYVDEMLYGFGGGVAHAAQPTAGKFEVYLALGVGQGDVPAQFLGAALAQAHVDQPRLRRGVPQAQCFDGDRKERQVLAVDGGQAATRLQGSVEQRGMDVVAVGGLRQGVGAENFALPQAKVGEDLEGGAVGEAGAPGAGVVLGGVQPGVQTPAQGGEVDGRRCGGQQAPYTGAGVRLPR